MAIWPSTELLEYPSQSYYPLIFSHETIVSFDQFFGNKTCLLKIVWAFLSFRCSVVHLDFLELFILSMFNIHLDFLELSMLLLMLFSSLVRLRPLSPPAWSTLFSENTTIWEYEDTIVQAIVGGCLTSCIGMLLWVTRIYKKNKIKWKIQIFTQMKKDNN